MANERITEDLVRGHFKNDPLFNTIKLEEQRSNNKRVVELLQAASKSGKGRGMPEFLISFPSQNSNYLIVIECKSETKNHKSIKFDKPKDYAVDGVLHYGRALSKEFDVICIAVSGQSESELLVSAFKQNKGEDSQLELPDISLRSINDYIKLFNNEHFEYNLKQVDIIEKAIHLNNLFQSFSVTENGRCTIVSAVLLSLMDNSFRMNYNSIEKSLYMAEDIIKSVERVLKSRGVKNIEEMIKEYRKIENEPIFKEEKVKINKALIGKENKKSNEKKKNQEVSTIEEIKEIVTYLYKNIYPLVTMDNAGFDVLGKFYTEFIRYAGSSQSQGLVLTPQHITELFCDLADITPKSIVYDPCCGSGGFLISAMKIMIEKAASHTEKESIKNSQLIGVERRPDMFTYACSNMLFRGDGKSNIYCGDCFNYEKIVRESHNPNVVFLNPPYDVGAVGQMQFIEHALNTIKQQGVVIAIVQMSCAIKNEKELVVLKRKLLNEHTLKAVVSMPDELFNPHASVPTCIMVWEANKKNTSKTWFGYLKDDGFEKRKHKGRVDVKKRWQTVKDKFLDAYKNNDNIVGLSVKKAINENEEWCAEAYMETDYSTLSASDFEDVIKRFYSFKYIYQNG